jgi:pimeloyl-ACP methyl ester carboxylesterase
VTKEEVMRLMRMVALLMFSAIVTNARALACCGVQVDKDNVIQPTTPPSPPEKTDQIFIQNSGAAFGGPCRFNTTGPLVFDLPVDRVYGDKDKLLAQHLLPKHARLTIAFWDIDLGGGERDVFNNKAVRPDQATAGWTCGWEAQTFLVDTKDVNFATDGGPGTSPQVGHNEVRIDIDVANVQKWCTAIAYATLEIEGPRPVVLVHSIFNDANIWNTTWKPRLDDSGIPNSTELRMSLASRAGDANQIRTVVGDAKTRFGVKKVNLVAYSSGGIDSREYISGSKDVEQLVQIGSPNAGSRFADLPGNALGNLGPTLHLPRNRGIDLRASGPYIRELRPKQMDIYNKTTKQNGKVKKTALAGRYEPDWHTWYYEPMMRFSGRPGDGVVTVASAHAISGDLPTLASSGTNTDAHHLFQPYAGSVFDMLKSHVMEFGTNAVTEDTPPTTDGLVAIADSLQQDREDVWPIVVDTCSGCMPAAVPVIGKPGRGLEVDVIPNTERPPPAT